ncbi:MAG: GNAT family N-acetyltransferase [Bacteroidetes bacterium]|nr:GNAT family N-acetyltransferase [Bacteroidota bacterium]MBI3483165.1 GNAT family N-acetyltransferase [Bacteroidota bacterium]
MDQISYYSDRAISIEQFIDLLQRSTLAERRPVNDKVKIEKMLTHGNILITAWHNELLVGVSRALTDFSFCCYLSDLAVDQAYQHKGIGKEMIRLTHKAAGENDTTLILLAAPLAAGYYPKIGMDRFTDCFIIKRKN